MSIRDMREPTFLILSSLAAGKRHGYGIITDTAELSEGRVTIKVGTLYAALDRLVSENLIRSAGDEIVDGRLRRYYELTDAGAEALNVEAQRLNTRASAALSRLATRSVGFAS